MTCLQTDNGNNILLEMTEALIAAHRAATLAGDTAALALMEPLLRHAGRRLAEDYSPLLGGNTAQTRDALAASAQVFGAKPSLN